MADRKAFYGSMPSHPELDKLIEQAKSAPATEVELREQRVSLRMVARLSRQALRKRRHGKQPSISESFAEQLNSVERKRPGDVNRWAFFFLNDRITTRKPRTL